MTQAGILAVGGASVWWLRENVIWPKPGVDFANAQGASGWMGFSDEEPRIIIIDVQVNGSPVRALLDSGAQSSVLDRGLAERLGVSLSAIAPVVAFGVSGSAQVGRTASIDVTMGELALTGLRTAVLELAPIANASRRHFSMIIGQDILEVLVADIDFPGGRVAFHDPVRHLMPQGAVAAPARTEGRELMVPIVLEGVPLEVVLDTGASGALALSPEAAQTAGLLDGRDVRTAPSITFGGVSNDRVIRAGALSFAGVDYPDVRVHIYTPAQGARIPPGLLGVEVLERFRVLLNVQRGELHLIPGEPRSRRRRR